MEFSYGYSKQSPYGFTESIDRVTALLKEQGFGILTTIDVQEKMKEKLGKEMEQYVILGACNPPLAYEAIENETEIGLLLPCNVIVYVKHGVTHVSAIMPKSMMDMLNKPALSKVADIAEEKLRYVINNL